MTPAIAVVPAALPVEEAARLARRRGARLLVARLGRAWGGATPATLSRALGLGLGRAPVGALLWGAPAAPPAMAEVAVRRRLGPAVPFVVVVAGGTPVGAVLRAGGARNGLPGSAAEALARVDDGRARLLGAVGALGAEMGTPVAAVGGLVRDLLRGHARPAGADLDVVVGGDGRALARRLARALGGTVVEHAAFLTATVTLADGTRLDVATARRERYGRPGALPGIEPATLAEDLARRDFSVNALAIRLERDRWGEILDPTGGLADLRGRRIRILHPLSFVEDPTRVFRALRFAVRFGFALERTTRRLLGQAATLPVYEALSGDRLRAELALILAEPDPAATLVALGRAGAFRLLEAGYRFPVSAARLLRKVAATGRLRLGPDTIEALTVLALRAHLGAGAAEAWGTRLALPPAIRTAIARARGETPQLLARLARTRGVEEAYALLKAVPEVTAAWAHVLARARSARRRIADHLVRWRHLRPLLTGDDLRGLGLEPGPTFGRLLDGLLAAQAAQRVRDREGALRYVRAALATAAAPAARERMQALHADQRGG